MECLPDISNTILEPLPTLEPLPLPTLEPMLSLPNINMIICKPPFLGYNFSDVTAIHYLSNKIIKLYNTKNFIQLNNEINKLHDSRLLFLTQTDNYTYRVEIVDIFTKYIKIKNYIRAKLLAKRIKKCRLINECDINQTVIDEKTNYYELYDVKELSIYKLTLYELINIYKHSIQYREYDYSLPKSPRNPYTNLDFTLKQNIQIYHYILEQYCKKQRVLPSYMVYFKNSYFDSRLINKSYNVLMTYHCYRDYLDNMTNNEWWGNFKTFIYSHNILRQTFCIDCIKKDILKIATFNIFRRLISPVLCTHILNINNSWSMGNAVDNYVKIAQTYNIYYETNHKISFHRTVFKVRRNNVNNCIVNNPAYVFVNVDESSSSDEPLSLYDEEEEDDVEDEDDEDDAHDRYFNEYSSDSESESDNNDGLSSSRFSTDYEL